MRAPWWLVAGAALVQPGCGREVPADTSASADDAAFRAIELTEELRIGGLEGAEEYTFGYVSALAPAPDGAFYLVDEQVPVIRKYDAAGRYLFDVGRSGEGPGEYRGIANLGVFDDGRIAIWDPSERRLTTYTGDGAYAASTAIPIGLWNGFVVAPAGAMYLAVTPEGLPANVETNAPDWARVTLDGEVQRIATAPPPDQVGPRYVLSGRGGYYRPFVTMTLSAIGPDGSLYTVRNDEYRIRRLRPDGTETLIVRDEPRIRVSADEMREWQARSESFAARDPEHRSMFFPVPEEKPYIRELMIDPDGRLWVSRYTEAVFMEYSPAERAERESKNQLGYQWRDRLRWDVFDATDRYLGSVTFPFKTSLMTARGDRVWGVQAGDYREDYVVRWRMAME